MWVYFTHFLIYIFPDLDHLWADPPTPYVLRGVSGKLATAMFVVIAGYLAYSSGTSEKAKTKNALRYTVDRYIY